MDGMMIQEAMEGDEMFLQAGFVVENCGFIVPTSKKRITWRFLKRGDDTPHTVTLIWSKNTGKQCVLMDGEEIYFGINEGSSIVSYQWTARDGTAYHILACSTSPNENATGGFQKYDLILNNQTFSSLRRFSDGYKPPKRGMSFHPTSIAELLFPEGYQVRETLPDAAPHQEQYHPYPLTA